MHYSTRIEDYLDAINGVEAFFVAEREHFKVINYISMGNDVFPDPASASDDATARRWYLRRQCRGLIFNHNGDVISLPIKKFFNANERAETQLDRIDLSQPHVILEKLDGSMCRPIPIGSDYRMGTKMGITTVAMMAEEFVAEHLNYDKFIRATMADNLSPQFEFCSRKQRIVLDYLDDRLVLLSIRSLATGQDLSIAKMQEYANMYDIDVVGHYPGTVSSIEQLVADTKGLFGQEGWVIKFTNCGNAIKIKADDYRLKHSAKDSILRENNVITLILSEQIDDVKPLLDTYVRTKVEEFETSVWAGINNTMQQWIDAYCRIRTKHSSDRKSFALDTEYANIDRNFKSAVFTVWEKELINWHSVITDIISRNLSSQTKVDDIRYMWGGAKYTVN